MTASDAYRFNEGSVRIDLDNFTDRTANMLILGSPESSRMNITISRDDLKDGESLPTYVDRQIALMAQRIKGHKVRRRGPATLGSGAGAIVGECIDATHPNGSATYYQRQAGFALQGPFAGRVLVFSATRDRPFGDVFDAAWQGLLASFMPRD